MLQLQKRDIVTKGEAAWYAWDIKKTLRYIIVTKILSKIEDTLCRKVKDFKGSLLGIFCWYQNKAINKSLEKKKKDWGKVQAENCISVEVLIFLSFLY